MRYSILSALVLGTVGIFADQPYPTASHTVTASYAVPSDSSTITIHHTGPPPHSTYVPTSYHTDCGDHCGGTCGDGVVQAPYEECDLGPKLNGAWNSGCSDNCTCVPVCGDGKVEGTETCDLGSENGKWNSGCSSTCTCTPVCGNGIKEGNEACDLGADNGKYNSGCSATCEITPIWTERIAMLAIRTAPMTAVVRLNASSVDIVVTESLMTPLERPAILDISSMELPVQTAQLPAQPKHATRDITTDQPADAATAAHGTNALAETESLNNGKTDLFASPEECDDGELNGTWGSHCNTNCTLKEPCGNPNPPKCGNGIVDPEVCDDGYLNGGEYSNCTTDCTYCNTEAPRCGDGHIDYELGETCDDGLDNGTPQSSCTSTCQPCDNHKPTTPCATCNPNPFLNKCTITTSCIDTPTGNDYCACRAGYRADGLDATDARQFRLAFPGQEYRVFVAPGVECNTLCTTPFPGPDSCQEVPVQVTC
ncbi:hypothetical protein IFR05_005491 [Cadophora sp. M221]|nr:hypothetical protein IFR05_005491 [Cadophora sp. M221]